MDNAEIFVESVSDACTLMAGNIDRFLPKGDRLTVHFVSAVSQVAAVVRRDRLLRFDEVGTSARRSVGRAAGKLMSAYRASQILHKKYRLCARLRLTECGSQHDRVWLEENGSKVITIQDLQLNKFFETTIRVLVNEASGEIRNILAETASYSIGA